MKMNFRRRSPLYLCFFASAAALAGCSTEESYQKPFFSFLSSYNSADSGVPVLLRNDAWWNKLGDQTLNTLIAKAFEENVDLEIARERVVEAHANLDGVPPQGEITPSASVMRGEDVLSTSRETRSEATLGIAWLLDPYGLRRQRIQSAAARVEVADAEVDAARLVVILNMANAYIDLRYNQRLLHLRQQQLASRRQTVDLTRRLFEQGSATRLELVRAEALVAETQTQIPPLKATIQKTKNNIAVLAGRAPGQLGVDLAQNRSQPRPQMAYDIGIPADLVRNRPDIRVAERSYYAAVSEIGIARADLYPRLSLGGSIGPKEEGGVSGIEYFFGPSITFPSLLNTSLKANVKVRHSQARQAHQTWKSTVLTALQEVENGLVSYEGSARSVQTAQRTARLYGEARNLTRELVQNGSATIPSLISAEQDVADADVVLAQSVRQLGRDFIQLNVSLGAGSNVGDDTTRGEAKLALNE